MKTKMKNFRSMFFSAIIGGFVLLAYCGQLYSQQSIDINEKSVVTKSNFDKYNKKAENGDAKAQIELGKFYFLKKEFEQAIKWYRKSAEQGNAIGQGRLGLCYYEGHGVKKDEEKAIKWLRKAAEKGDPLIQYTGGILLLYKDNINEQELEEGIQLLTKSAQQGYEPAIEMLNEVKNMMDNPSTKMQIQIQLMLNSLNKNK
jgi:tetratricopeptide (TPR) repeat protein